MLMQTQLADCIILYLCEYFMMHVIILIFFMFLPTVWPPTMHQ